ncbi:MAG: FxDxF family PEP-CTERM protein [Nitrosospira sp.]|nr:FxDxF family PEP-CTERM protein [Nitrosospira sp.]
MKTFVKNIMLVVVFCISSVSAFADTITNLSVGILPTSLTYGNSFASASSGSTFWDDFIFTIPDGSANSVTSSINLGTILGLTDLRARLYTGSTHETGPVAPGTLMQAWGTTVNYSPTVSATTVVLNPLTLDAGTYTLQIRGAVAGLFGGSYAGVLNIAPPPEVSNTSPVPEPETYAMFLAGLGLMGFIARRKKSRQV